MAQGRTGWPALCLMAAGAARAELPAPLLAEAQANVQTCREAGGTPRMQGVQVPGAGLTDEVHVPYVTQIELNGDGQPDYVTDLAGLECENAWSLFCGSAGCPVTVWLSGPGGLAVAWGGHAQAWRLEGRDVVVALHGQLCSPPRAGHDGCEERLRLAAAPPAPSPPAQPPAPPQVAAPPAPAPGTWRHGQTADGRGMYASALDPATGARLDWLCAPGIPSLLAVTPAPATRLLVFEVDGRRLDAAPRIEGGTAYLPIAFTAPLFAHLASGPSFGVAGADGRPIGRFSLIEGTGAIGVAEGTCQAMR